MIYRVVIYDKTTDRMKGSLHIPDDVLPEVKEIAGFKPEDDGLGEYPLDAEQTKRIAKLLQFNPEPDRFFYYVEPYEPPDDDGFQRITTSSH